MFLLLLLAVCMQDHSFVLYFLPSFHFLFRSFYSVCLSLSLCLLIKTSKYVCTGSDPVQATAVFLNELIISLSICLSVYLLLLLLSLSLSNYKYIYVYVYIYISLLLSPSLSLSRSIFFLSFFLCFIVNFQVNLSFAHGRRYRAGLEIN